MTGSERFSPRGEVISSSKEHEPIPGSVGIVFSGQGLRRRGDLYAHIERLGSIDPFTVEKNIYLVKEASGLPLFTYIRDRDESILARTDVLQAMVHSAHLAAIEMLRPYFPDSKQIAKVAGHSGGEIAAQVAAGVLTPEDSAKVIAKRGQAMHEAAVALKSGLIIPIGFDGEEIEVLLKETQEAIRKQGLHDQIIALALSNEPNVQVIGGTELALAIVREIAAKKGMIRLMQVDAEGAFHTEAMRTAMETFGPFYKGIQLQEPLYTVVLNNGVETIDPEKMREVHIDRMVQPVDWVGAMNHFRDIQTIIKVGPGGQVPGVSKANGILDKQAVSIIDFFTAA